MLYTTLFKAYAISDIEKLLIKNHEMEHKNEKSNAETTIYNLSCFKE